MFGKKKKVDPKAAAQPQIMKGIRTLERGMVSLSDIIAPSSIEVDFRFIRVGEKYYTTLFMVGYPRYVSANWLQPIVDYDHTMDISMFVYPTSSSDVLDDLKRKILTSKPDIWSTRESRQL